MTGMPTPPAVQARSRVRGNHTETLRALIEKWVSFR